MRGIFIYAKCGAGADGRDRTLVAVIVTEGPFIGDRRRLARIDASSSKFSDECLRPAQTAGIVGAFYW
jgi:hypothetical protein